MKFSTTGRPRRLTDAQIAEIAAWHKTKLTNAQMAAKYGIGHTTLERVLRTLGKDYKQAPPVSA